MVTEWQAATWGFKKAWNGFLFVFGLLQGLPFVTYFFSYLYLFFYKGIRWLTVRKYLLHFLGCSLSVFRSSPVWLHYMQQSKKTYFTQSDKLLFEESAKKNCRNLQYLE
jgi:hypothetical protein